MGNFVQYYWTIKKQYLPIEQAKDKVNILKRKNS